MEDWEVLDRESELRGVQLIDATCPDVQKIFTIAKEYAAGGYAIVILGDRHHPEVQAACSWAGAKAEIVADYHEFASLNISAEEPIVVLTQSTLDEELFMSFALLIRRNYLNSVVINSICPATRLRQEAATELAARVHRMIVVGGLHSANSRRLFDLCLRVNPQTVLIEKAEDLIRDWFNGATLVGLTAGASTPQRIIEEVETKVMEWTIINPQDSCCDKVDCECKTVEATEADRLAPKPEESEGDQAKAEIQETQGAAPKEDAPEEAPCPDSEPCPKQEESVNTPTEEFTEASTTSIAGGPAQD